MDKRVVLGGVVGGIVILAFAFGILMVMIGYFPSLTIGSGAWIDVLPLFMAPVAGGFLSGLIGKSNPKKAGLIAGLLAGIVVCIGWVVYVGLGLESILTGAVIVLLWVILARSMAKFAQPR